MVRERFQHVLVGFVLCFMICGLLLFKSSLTICQKQIEFVEDDLFVDQIPTTPTNPTESLLKDGFLFAQKKYPMAQFNRLLTCPATAIAKLHCPRCS